MCKKGSEFYCCTERELLGVIFSMSGLESIRDQPGQFLEQSVGSFLPTYFERLPVVRGGVDVAEAWWRAADLPLATLIVDGDSIATPWDLIVTPFVAGKLLL